MDIIVKDIKICDFDKSKFVKPYRISYNINGKASLWDCVKVYDSVCALIYHTQKDAFLFVKQFRPSLWFWEQQNTKKQDGFSLELCAGIKDKGISDEKTIIEEIFEETGYKIDKVSFINSSFSGLGFATNSQSLFYAQIDETQKKSQGGGVDGEFINLVFIPRKEILNFIYDDKNAISTSTFFAIHWFEKNIRSLD